jgi:hypothetical protein
MPAKAYSTKGLKILLGDGSAPVALVPTAITSAKPANVTVANTLADGDTVYCANTGFPELDGKWFVIGGASATEFDLIGSDTTGSTGSLAAAPSIEAYPAADAADESCLFKGITFNQDAPAAVQAGTYCDPSLAVTSPVVPPATIVFTGNVNVADPAYRELIDAQNDGLTRTLDIVLPFGQGDIIAPVVVSIVTWDMPVDGVQGFSATMTCASRPQHVF